MIRFAALIEEYGPALQEKYAARLLPGHRHALSALQDCRTEQAGTLSVHCPECGHREQRPRSCGHRSCPRCQNHEATVWLERQQAKLLPVDYYMATFTLPCQFRSVAWCNQTAVYNILLNCATGTLKDFGLNPANLGAALGMTAVLHTHSRRLDYHPHVHVVIPGGGINRLRREWRTVEGKFLFNESALARVFRARFLDALNKAGLPIPCGAPKEWVVNCTRVGSGLPALQYLSRYLYRGVVSERSIVSNQNGYVTFRYTDGKTGKTCYRTLKGEDFLWLVLQHVLPKGFRRVRDYGFLHGNAKKLLRLVQLVLRVVLQAAAPKPRPPFKCPCCKAPMRVAGFRPPLCAAGGAAG